MSLVYAIVCAASLGGGVAVDPALAAGTSEVDAGYSELAAGQNELAIARLEELRRDGEANPAVLVNLAAAYERAGRFDLAREIYAEVGEAEELELQTGEGAWRSSHEIAELGLARLERANFAAK